MAANASSEGESLIPLTIGEVGGLAIDVNVYRSAGFRFFDPPFSTLANVSRWKLKVLVPEIWELELRAHLCEWMSARLGDARHILKFAPFGDGNQALATRAVVDAWASETAESVALRAIEKHFGELNASRLKTAWAKGSAVLEDYFSGSAPFEKSGSKKSEFPDAFALRTLEDWAQRAGQQVLVVSGDAGCLAACTASPQLIGVPTLVAALNALSAADAERRAKAARYEEVLVREIASEVSQLRKELDSLLAQQLIDDFDIEARPWFMDDHYDAHVDDVQLRQVIASSGMWPPSVTVVSIGANSLTFTWSFVAEIEVTARFSRPLWGARTRRVETSSTREVSRFDLRAVVTLHTLSEMSPEAVADGLVRRMNIEDRQLRVLFRHVDVTELPPD
jgi:hypothetical protein